MSSITNSQSKHHLAEVLKPENLDSSARCIQTSVPRFDLFRLHLFIAIARCGSLTAAGDMVNQPQSIMSRHVARLEKDFGGKLFERHGRGVVLSDLGHHIFPAIERLLQQADELSRTIDEYENQPHGDVRVGLPSSFRGFLTVALFFKLKERYPQVRLTLKEGSSRQVEHWLRNGEIDLGLTHRYGRFSDLHADRLFSLDLYLVGPSGDVITKKDSVDFKQIAGLPLILPQSPSEFRSRLDQIAKSQSVKLDVIMEAEFGQIHRDLTKLGAYCFSTWHVISEYVNAGELQVSRIVNPGIQREIALAYSPSKTNGQTNRAVSSLIKEIMASEQVAKAMLR